MKRKFEEESEKEVKKTKLPEKVDGVSPADKEVSAMKGAKVDAFFYPKTESPKNRSASLFQGKPIEAGKTSTESPSREEKCKVESNVPLYINNGR